MGLIAPNALVAIAFEPDVGAAWRTVGGPVGGPVDDGVAGIGGDDVECAEWPTAVARIAEIEGQFGPRWLWWSGATARALVAAGIRPARCWDLEAVHRVLVGGWRSDPAQIWAAANDLPTESIPDAMPVDLFHQMDGHGGPIRDDGYLEPGWATGEHQGTLDELVVWTELAVQVHARQEALLEQLPGDRALATARAESAAETLCAELEVDGLPLDVAVAESVIGELAGPRPADAAEAARLVQARDREVLRHAPADGDYDLRNPAQVKSLLRRVGVELPDTRAWRLEANLDRHPIVGALLEWRKAERISTTFGYGWLDEHVAGGRLRGRWSGSDGAAGRMTATAGLHNMPAELRRAVVAEPDYVFVRADLGQIEPRVLAAVSGDEALARATAEDDMYLPVAARLRVEREIAKVAVLGAMYGQTTGKGAEALAGLEAAYPVAMTYLRTAAGAAEGGRDLRTYGGRLIRMGGAIEPDTSDRDRRVRAASRGRYGRNAMIQGAAAELFKTWAVITRARTVELGAEIVLCLHYELLVHAPGRHADATVTAVDAALDEAAHRWSPHGGPAVRFVADTTIVARWSDAKTPSAGPGTTADGIAPDGYNPPG